MNFSVVITVYYLL